MFPIKYIENNLVFNHDGECFAYYELIPYNYSFLSPEEKYMVHDNFRQLIAQNRDGKIHALQISTESSIRQTQERSKKEVTGRLREVACAKIDEQTEALVEMIGENQIDYRFFLGFKLLVNEEEISLKHAGKSAAMTFADFLYEVNHQLMGDFVSMSNDEIARFQKMEKLLESKISRRFKIRRLEKHDFGYLIEHIYGKTGVAYEDYADYAYDFPVKKLKKETLVKRYDLIRPTRCQITENQRYLKMDSEEQTTYAAYFTINNIVGELDFPSSEIFYYQQQQFTFPVSTSMNVEIVTNKKALTTVRNKKKELKDLDNHAWESNNETSNNVVDALDSVNELETTLDQSKESMYKLSYVVRVAADSLDELKRRCDEVKDFYDDLNVKLVRPFGDMLGLHGEFLPASKRYINDYIQYVTSDFLAGLGFGATQQLGESDGIYIGYNLDTGRNVYLKPSLAAQGVKGSVTNALAAAFLGSLGGGKSFCNNLIVYYAVLFGGSAVIVDPKSERGNWKETLPEIAQEINIVNLTSEAKNKGLLDPYVIMKNLKDAESLAIDILTFLTGISSRDGEKFPVLRKAIRSVTHGKRRGLLCVIDELRKEGTPVASNIAEHIESLVDYDFSHLLFSDGAVEQSISLDKQLNIIQVADLVLPDRDTKFEEYTTMELLSVAMLIVISTFALDYIHSDRSIFKMVDLDEAWTFLQVAQGKALSNKLIRAGRSMNAAVYFVTQNSGDVDDENNQKRLRDLENGQCLFQDLYGRVGVIQIHPVFADLFHAFDTRPPIQTEEKR
ncbi:TPA: ATP-binding protein [Clostridioides difficile]